MPKYTLFYRGGKPDSARVAAERQPGWNAWFASLGNNLVDRGAPTKSLVVAGADGAAEFEPTTGYSVVIAASKDEAVTMALTCPIYNEGGVVEVARYVDPVPL